jgi:hypothetical protein
MWSSHKGEEPGLALARAAKPSRERGNGVRKMGVAHFSEDQ